MTPAHDASTPVAPLAGETNAGGGSARASAVGTGGGAEGGGRAPALVDRAIAGDHAALRALWENNRRWVAAVLLAHKPASADVDDLLQEVAVALVAKISTLGEPANFQPWLRVVALNVARLAGRKFAAGPRMVRGADLSGGPDGEGGGGPLALRASGEAGPSTGGGRSQVSEEAQRLMALARELPEEYREPLLLRCVQELSYQKISAILGLPETTIETRIARGRRMLRERAVAAAAVGAGKVGGRMAASPGYPA